jgi:predicted Zn-dependent peptidase
MSAIDVSEALARLGADYDVDVAPDVTTFSLTTLMRFASRGAALLSDMVARPSFRESDFGRIRQLRLDRLKQIKDLPPAVAERALLRLLYGRHPYGHVPLGSRSALEHIVLDEAERFHRDTFHPSESVVVVGGPLSHAELAGLASEAFAAWAEADRPRRPAGFEAHPIAPSERRLSVIARESAAQSEVRIGQLSAGRNTPDYHSLVVMNAVLGGQFVSRVNLKLREEKGYTYGARTGFDWRRGLSPFVLQTSVHTASTAEAVRDSLAEIEGIRDGRPVSEHELALAKASLTRGYSRNFETVQQVARSVAQLALYGLPDTYFAEFVPKVNAVTTADVTRVAKRYLEPERLTTVIVGDHSAIADPLARLGVGEVDVLSLEW